jgi:hypothetical protein
MDLTVGVGMAMFKLSHGIDVAIIVGIQRLRLTWLRVCHRRPPPNSHFVNGTINPALNMKLLYPLFVLLAPAVTASSILSPRSFGPRTDAAPQENSKTLRWSESDTDKRAPEENMESLNISNKRATLAPRKDRSRAFNVKLHREEYSGTQLKKYEDLGDRPKSQSWYFWEFYETTRGFNARCGDNPQNRSNQTKEYVLRSNHEANTGCSAHWEGVVPNSVLGAFPGGTYKIKFVGNDNCEYKNDGHSYGALYCDGQVEMSCRFEDAVLTNPDPRGKDGVWDLCGYYQKEQVVPLANGKELRTFEEMVVYQLPFILCEY